MEEVNLQSRHPQREIARKRRELADVSRDLDGLVDAIVDAIASGVRRPHGGSSADVLVSLSRPNSVKHPALC